MAVRFGVLGAIAVWRGGVPVDVGHARQRWVLGALLADADGVVSADVLVDRVWGADAPGRGREALYGYMSRLRRVLSGLGADIVRDRGGYRLKVSAGSVDVHRFRDLADHARAVRDDEQAASLWEEALGLWRGEAYAGVDTPWFNAQRDFLERERLAAQLNLADIRLRLGQHDRVLAELFARAEAHPLDERMAGQLMLALYRGGRSADALTCYQEIRRRLGEELGTDPGAALRQLHQQVLTADPALTTAARESEAGAGPESAAVPRQLPAPPSFFVGRDRELAHLDRLLESQAERGGTVVISAIGGTGGIGKTWLALRWAHQQQKRFPDGQLYADLRGFSPSEEPVPPEVALRMFLDALGVAPAQIPADLDAQAALYRTLVADRRLIIVLDNSRDTAQVLPLLPGSPHCTVLVTSRHQLGGLITTHGGTPLTLDALTDAEAHELLTRHLGPHRTASEPEAVSTLLKHCAGLPLAISILAARATMNPALTLAALAAELQETTPRLDALDAGETTANLRSVFAASYRALAPQTADVFRQLALAPGPDISLPAAASLTALPLPRLRTHVRELQAAHLLQEHTLGRYTFHDLLRAYATELADTFDTDRERSATLGRILDHYVHTAHTANRLLLPHRDPISLTPAADGVSPEQLTTHHQALEWFTRERAPLTAAVEHAALVGSDARAWELAWTNVTFLSRGGLWHDVETVERTALAAATRLGERSAQAECHRELAYAFALTGRGPEASRALLRALELSTEAGDVLGQAHTHIALGWLHEYQGDQQTAFRHDLTALEFFTSLGHRPGRARALNAVGWDHIQLGHHQQAISHCREALALQQELQDERGQAATWDTLGYAYQQTDDYRNAIDSYQHSLELNQTLGHRYNEAETLVHLGETHRAIGALNAAQDAWQQAIAILTEAGHYGAELDRIRAMLQNLDGALA
ncbi:BTAD domain-containing putative transcriptional regulator [Streptomyces sp. 35G-GA-8]|uniref:AfsR/SARP family transcriptional regulator n=1 Tax=Streptomyces sp. 35G-GA-8 TaxID=2939434 RepID=UPI00201F5E74|nr:BTAD domain-containing putative transcriptional regulator [Streptomyces sp. 35G-GA-8]MCL7382592.1 tetratricopeptide repeat protein [Streptomyces sp. 35G-GA-8]